MEINNILSEAQNNTTSEIDSPLILQREIKTEVVAADGQTILLAGLQKENKSSGENAVPWFSEIPLLGYLFKTQSQGSDSTELVVFITPHIIRDQERLKELQNTILNNFEQIKFAHDN